MSASVSASRRSSPVTRARAYVTALAQRWNSPRDQGADIESGPREYDYTPGYYALFLHGPDGLKLEIVHRPRERDLVRRVQELETRLRQLDHRAP